MDRDESYNGWANRETWALHLHLTNDEGLYELVREGVRAAVAVGESGADWLRGFVETLCRPDFYRAEIGDEYPDGLAMMAADVGSLWRVDWDAVAASLAEGDGAPTPERMPTER